MHQVEKVDASHQSAHPKPVYIGEILKSGQFKIVYASDGLVSPDSYSSYLWPDGNFQTTGGPNGDGSLIHFF